jgi:hypothetical protein
VARPRNMFDFMEIKVFCLLIFAFVLITELFDMVFIIGTAKFSDDFFCDVPTNILTVL